MTSPVEGRSTEKPSFDTSDASAEELIQELRSLPEGDPDRNALYDRIARIHWPVLRQLSRRYSNRGEPTDDLLQTALLGLMKAVQGFDASRGKPFLAYLMPMATGEIKRHFRDRTWAVRVPRRHQENRATMNRVTLEFSQRYGRSPTVNELAAELRLSVEETVELIEASAAYSTLSLETRTSNGEEEGATLGECLGGIDPMLNGVVDREALKPELARLPERERTILFLRFFQEQTQAEIAHLVGCSQMHVSRLLARSLQRLRQGMLSEY